MLQIPANIIFKAMPVEKKEFPLYTYIRYTRGEPQDVDRFKIELGNLGTYLSAMKDILIDLSESRNLTSSEINAMVRLVKICDNTTRVVRVITNMEVRRTVDSLNLRKLPHMVFYDSLIDFQIEWKKSQKGSGKPRSAHQ